jgi:hypothetical protein
MKTLFSCFATFLATLGATTVLASTCPDLTGKYTQIFPHASGTALTVTTSGDEVQLKVSRPTVTPWLWSLKTDGKPYEKAMPASSFTDLVQVASCSDRQIHVSLTGKKSDVKFVERWILYHNTSKEFVWQRDYQDDTGAEPTQDIYKFSAEL